MLAAEDLGTKRTIGWLWSWLWKVQISQPQYQLQKLAFVLLFCSFLWTVDYWLFNQRPSLCCSCSHCYSALSFYCSLFEWCFYAFCLSLPAFQRTCWVRLACKLQCIAESASVLLSRKLWPQRWGCGEQRNCGLSCWQKGCRQPLGVHCWFCGFLRPVPLSFLR